MVARPIKLFKFVQKVHQTIGIFPTQSNQKPCRINSMNTVFLICFAQILFSTAAYLAFEAKSMFEYGFTFYILVGITNSIAVYLIFIWQAQSTLEFIENCEKFIEARKWINSRRMNLANSSPSVESLYVLCEFTKRVMSKQAKCPKK